MIINQQAQQQNEDRFGNEVKRRRINDAGAHLKVWRAYEILYVLDEGKEEKDEEKEEVVVQVVQEPIQIKEEEEEVPAQSQSQSQEPPPMHLIGRTIIVQTTDQIMHHGIIKSLFALNGERAVHIQTTAGENLILVASQICGLELLHDKTEEMLSPIPRREEEDDVVQIEVQFEDDVVQIEDDAEVQHITQRMEVVQIESDESDSDSDSDHGNDNSDASTQVLEEDPDNQDDNQVNDDDFPDTLFQPARRLQESGPGQEEEPDQEEEEAGQEEEPNCCAICFDATDAARNCVSLNCGHQFHFACIMGNMANGGNNRNQCPMCRDAVCDVSVYNLDEIVENMIDRATRSNQQLQDELVQTQQHREHLTAEYMRVMSMNMQIGLRHNEEREARDALERRAYICGLNDRIADIVSSASNNDIRRQPGAAVHLERQIRDLCMSFSIMAYDAQYDDAQYQDQYQDQHQAQYQYQDMHDPMEVD